MRLRSVSILGVVLWKRKPGIARPRQWFFLTFVFLPGATLPAAKTIHSNETLLALGVLVGWHVYTSVFSLEVFSLDGAVFRGRISRAPDARAPARERAADGRAHRAAERSA